ncbi:MAG: hypothetical protein U1C58_06845 [Flavobacteriaceae bacterium]|nr:hypothetical protein [Flavobacteriaceae bacterium]
MENWYVPITILPGVALLILSTSNLLIALSGEIKQRIIDNQDKTVTLKKLKQLKLLNRGMVGFYIGSGCMVGAGIQDFLAYSKICSKILMLLGTLSIFVSIAFLIVFSIRAVRIRQEEFNDSI